jgi:2-alkenal reductase
MMNRFLGFAIFWLLVLATAFVAEPYMVAWRFSATSPRTITPRADLTEAERTTIKLFQSVSPSVGCGLIQDGKHMEVCHHRGDFVAG